MKRFIVIFFGLVCSASAAFAGEKIKIGSKADTEGVLLAELGAQIFEAQPGAVVLRQFALGNTGIVLEALKKGEIDVYPEYTGTIREAILREPSLIDFAALSGRLRELGLVVSRPLGFSNTYALAVTRQYAESHGLRKISDLRAVAKDVRSAFSHEFVNRADGLMNLLKRYRLQLGGQRQSLEHSLAYEAIASRKVDLIEVYSTDSQIARLDLVVLEDDLRFFPEYDAVYLARADFVARAPEAWAALNHLAGTIDADKMRSLNAQVEQDKRSAGSVIAEYLNKDAAEFGRTEASIASRIWRRTKEHFFLVGVTVFLSVLTGVPLGILSARRERIGQALLLASSVVQTIPSLALLCLLIPFFGIGLQPALVALYLYALLPILSGTYLGLRSIDPSLIETSHAMGLSSFQRIRYIELPLASRNIIGGVRTATIIGIGTATLAALIGAGGYGAPIVSGLAMNDMNTVLMGAVPAALMSLLVHFAFVGIERVAVPKGLRL